MNYTAIKPSELRVGDIITAQWTPSVGNRPSELFTEVVVTKVGPKQVLTDNLHFRNDCNTFYLIERPKQPLPKTIGSVVEVDGVKYVRVLKDNKDYYEWVKSEDAYNFCTISTEQLAEYDYTVVSTSVEKNPYV